MKLFLHFLLPCIAMLPLAGCGDGGGNAPSANGMPTGQVAEDIPPLTAGGGDRRSAQDTGPQDDADAVARLEATGARLRRDDDGLVTGVIMPKEADDGALVPLTKLARLQSLSLGETQITDAGLQIVGQLFQLTSLDLDYAEISDKGLAYLEGLSGLEQLSLAWTEVTDEGIARLTKMTNLRDLDLSWAGNLTDECLVSVAELASLEKLNVAWTSLSDDGLSQLESLANLRSLVVKGSDVTEEGSDKLASAMPELKIWYHEEAPVEGELATSEVPERKATSPTAIGQVAPEIEGEDIDGVAFKLSDYRGKVVMLDFWGHW